MSTPGSVTHWLRCLQQRDDYAASQVWNRYFERLIAYARSRLRSVARRDFDEEDIVLSAFDSFYRGVQRGTFRKLEDRQDLWQLLVVITARKAVDQRVRQRRQKRGGGLVRGDSIFALAQAEGARPTIEAIIGREPSPEFAAQVADELRHLLQQLPNSTLSKVAVWKMEGYTNAEIAGKLGCQTRTVERKLRLIRNEWSQFD